jgi:hypothetical protein
MGDPVPDTDATVTLVLLNMSPKTVDRHANAVADVQDDDRQLPRSPLPPRSSPAVAVCSPTPKLRPDTVTDVYPLYGTFSRTSEATALSKLKTGLPVPETAETVSEANAKMSAKAFDSQIKVVAVVQDDVKHKPSSSPKVVVRSLEPKDRPETLKDDWPLCGALSLMSEAMAASKLKIGVPVPTTEPTVRLAALLATSLTLLERQITVVAVVHDDVKHTPFAAPASSSADAVCSPAPKLSPDTVNEEPPLGGLF